MNVITSKNETHNQASARLNAHAALTHIANVRTPVARYVGTEDVPNPPAPAWYVPQTGDIYIHADEAGIDTDNVRGMGTGFDWAKSEGLLAHEASHAAISEALRDAEKLAPHHSQLLTTFEEVRVENHAIRRFPRGRSGLRASFTIVLKGIRSLDTTSKPTVARAWALVQGRTLGGIATMAETKPMDEAARVLLGDDTVDALMDLLQETVTLILPRDTARLIEICDEWVELVGEETSDGDDSCDGEPDGTGARGKGKGEGEGEPGKGGGKSDKSDEDDDTDDDTEPGDNTDKGEPDDTSDDESDDGRSKSDPEPDEGDGELDWDLGEKGSIVSTPDDDDETGDPTSEAKELTDAALKHLEETLSEDWNKVESTPIRWKSMEAAHRVFGNKRKSTTIFEQEPMKHHRQAVLEVSKVLSDLSLPAISKVARPAVLPPGRLRSREAVRASAERAQGRMVSAEPWRGSVRRHSTARPLVVGIATDTSASMKWAEQTVADFAYVWTNAGHRIGARTAAVTFGDNVKSIARPGEILSVVRGVPADDGTEECDLALAALDGVLHLAAPSYAARILIVVSDAYLVKYEEQEKVELWLRDFDRAGTHVLWVGSSAYDEGVGWIKDLHLDNVTIVQPPTTTGRYGTVGFDRLNEATLAAVKANIR
ncbi:MAG TPA: hypothetical protein VH482_17370 [Thermomicrobiales bacterium]|jgi:hypothetical protein